MRLRFRLLNNLLVVLCSFVCSSLLVCLYIYVLFQQYVSMCRDEISFLCCCFKNNVLAVCFMYWSTFVASLLCNYLNVLNKSVFVCVQAVLFSKILKNSYNTKLHITISIDVLTKILMIEQFFREQVRTCITHMIRHIDGHPDSHIFLC